MFYANACQARGNEGGPAATPRFDAALHPPRASCAHSAIAWTETTMFQILRPRTDRLDIDFSGRIDGDGMRELLDELMRKSAGIEHGRMLYRVREFEWPTPGAIGMELMRAPELLELMRRFDRVAVLADEEWVRLASRFEGALMPRLELRAFALDEEAEAEAWLAR